MLDMIKSGCMRQCRSGDESTFQVLTNKLQLILHADARQLRWVHPRLCLLGTAQSGMSVCPRTRSVSAAVVNDSGCSGLAPWAPAGGLTR
jgi:hypothetical protein